MFEHETQTLSPDNSFRAAEEAELGTGVQNIAVHWGYNILAYTDGEKVVISAFSGTLSEGSARASLLVDLKAPQGATVSALTWIAPATPASSSESSSSPVPSVLCIACDDLLSAFEVHRRGEQLVSRRLNSWQAAGNKWRALCANSNERVVAALGLRTVHVYGLEPEAAVATVTAPPAGGSPFTAFAWVPAADPHLALASSSGDVVLCSWKIGPTGWGSMALRVLLLDKADTFRCITACGDNGVLVATCDMPVNFKKSIVDPAFGAPSEPPEDGDGMVLLQAPKAAEPAALLTSQASIPSMFLLSPPAPSPLEHVSARVCIIQTTVAGVTQNATPTSNCTRLAACDLPGLTIPDVLCAQGALVVVGSSKSPEALLLTFSLVNTANGTGLVPQRRLHCSGGPLASAASIFQKGVAISPAEHCEATNQRRLCVLLGQNKNQSKDNIFMSSKGKFSLQVAMFVLIVPDAPLPLQADSVTPMDQSRPVGIADLKRGAGPEQTSVQPARNAGEDVHPDSLRSIFKKLGVVEGSMLRAADMHQETQDPAETLAAYRGPTDSLPSGPCDEILPIAESSPVKNPDGNGWQQVAQHLAALDKSMQSLQEQVNQGLSQMDCQIKLQADRITGVEAAIFRLSNNV